METKITNEKIQSYKSITTVILLIGYTIDFTLRRIKLNEIFSQLLLVIFTINTLLCLYVIVLLIKNNSSIVKPHKSYLRLSLILLLSIGFIVVNIIFNK